MNEQYSVQLNRLISRRLNRRHFLGGLGAAAISLKVGSAYGATDVEKGPLIIYNWGEYGPVDSNLAGFQEELGVKARIEFFSNNEEMLTQMRAGASGWDVIVPSDNQVPVMLEENLLLALEHERIPNIANIDPAFLNPAFDPSNKFSIPKTWGASGFMWRSDILGEGHSSWADFVTLAKENSGKAVIMDSPGDVFGAVFRATGHSMNDTGDAALEAVEAWLLDIKPHLLAIVPQGTIAALITSEEALMALCGVNDVGPAREHNPVEWAYATEGGLQFLDSWVIPKTAPNPKLAHAFINFMNTAQAAADDMNALLFNTMNTAAVAKGLIDEEVAEFAQLASKAVGNYEFQQPLDAVARRKRDEVWTKFLSA